MDRLARELIKIAKSLVAKHSIDDIKQVVIRTGEAQFSHWAGKKFRSVKDAQKAFSRVSGPDMGYDKVFVTLVFKDGDKLAIRYDHSDRDASFTETVKYYLK